MGMLTEAKYFVRRAAKEMVVLFPKMPIDLVHKNAIALSRGYSHDKKISRT